MTEFLRDSGHEVILARERLPLGSDDTVIAAVGQELDAVVVTWNHKHFKPLAARPPEGGRPRYPRLQLVSFRCAESRGVARMREVIELIEFELGLAERRRDKRVLIEVLETVIRVVR